MNRRIHAPIGPFPRRPSAETDAPPNPLPGGRPQVTFLGLSGHSITVPGYFDGDGQGGSTAAGWRVRFSTDEAGPWWCRVSFRHEPEVAIQLEATTPALALSCGSGPHHSESGYETSP